MNIFSINKHRKANRIADTYMPHRQLFKPENWIENVFAGLSVFSVLVLILSNIVNIDSSLKSLVPHFIVQNFQQIMHVIHMGLIIYVIIVMRNLYEGIRKIDKHKYGIAKEIKKQQFSWLNVNPETILEWWERWIDENINISKTQKNKEYCGENNTYKIEARIEIANSSLQLFHVFWLCIWCTWLLMYLSMFIGEFAKTVIADPFADRYRIGMSKLTFKDKNNNEWQWFDSTIFPNGIRKDSFLIAKNTDTVKKFAHRDIIIYDNKKNANSKYKLSKDKAYFFNWNTNDKEISTNYRIYTLIGDNTYRVISDTMLTVSTASLKKTSDKFIHRLNRDSVQLLSNAIFDVKNNDSTNALKGDKIYAIKLTKEKQSVKAVSLDSVNIVVSGYSRIDGIQNIFVFVENATGHIINLFFFMLYYIFTYKYVNGRRIKDIFRNARKEKKIKTEPNEIETELKKINRSFFMFFGIAISVTLLFIILDIFWVLIYPDNKIWSQLIVSTLCSISMWFLFGQMNNGNLRLPTIAVAVMYFYAAIQLFAPFRGFWIMSEQYISPNTFTFLITTLCFVAKFMVFLIIRWLFSEGRLAYFFIETSFYRGKNIPEHDDLFNPGTKKTAQKL